jgi:hypothetical protein
MRVNEENKHLIKISEKHSLYLKKYYDSLSDEKKKANKERARQYYLDNKEKLNTQRKINYCKQNMRKTEAELLEEVKNKKEKQKEKLTKYLEKLVV